MIRDRQSRYDSGRPLQNPADRSVLVFSTARQVILRFSFTERITRLQRGPKRGAVDTLDRAGNRIRMKVLIVGNLGMLGSDLMKAFTPNHEVIGVDRAEMDVTDESQCNQCIRNLRPDVVINAAALTDVDYCEYHQEEALLINGDGAGNLARAAAAAGSQFVHYSTDYVFDGLKEGAYLEEDRPNPQSVYGMSKMRGEKLVRSCCPDALILRTAWLFGFNGKNFVRTILGAARERTHLRVVDDQKGSPSYTKDLAAYTVRMVSTKCRGIYHLTNAGSCTWYELAVHAMACAGITGVEVTPVTTADFPRPARRPANSVLENSRLRREGMPMMRPWQAAAQEYIALL
jgi:dTDP-4-dehydrorhamnose reductase